MQGFLQTSGCSHTCAHMHTHVHTHRHTRRTRDSALVPTAKLPRRQRPTPHGGSCLPGPARRPLSQVQSEDSDRPCVPCGSWEGSLAARAGGAGAASTCRLGAHAVLGAGLAAPPTALQTGFGGRLRPLVAARRRRQKAGVLQEHRLSRVTAETSQGGGPAPPPSVQGTKAGPPGPGTAAAPGRFPGPWIQSRQQQECHHLAGALGLARGISGPKPLGSIEGVPAGTGSCWLLSPPPQTHQLSQPGSR